MNIFYDDDANIEIIQKLKVSIVGYGSQGHAHANNLSDSGVDVTVALREGSSSWEKAEEAGLKVMPVDEATKDADLVMILAPDEFQKGIYEKSIKPNLKNDAILAFAHGFNIHFKKIIPASTNVSYPAFIRAVMPPHSTACSPKRSVSVSSLNVVSKTPALVPPLALA